MNDLVSSMLMPPVLKGIKRALFIQPHPDDNEIGAGGIIGVLRSQNTEVYGLTVMDDHGTYRNVMLENGLTVRQNEALAAMGALGVKNAGFLGFEDKTQASCEDISAEIVKVIRRLQPDAVFSVDPLLKNECHRDHIKTGWAVRYAVMDAECGFYPQAIDGKPREDVWRVSILGQYYTDEPNTIVDVSPYWEKKIRAISCHKSQVNEELLQLLEAQANHFGSRCGSTYGEAIKLLSFGHLHCFNLPVHSSI